MLLLPVFSIFDVLGVPGGISSCLLKFFIVLVFYIKLTYFLSSYNFVRDLLSLFFSELLF